MITLDASVLIAFLSPHDRHHERAVEIFEEHAPEGFRIHQLTLAEVLVGATRAGRANQLLDDLSAIGVSTHESGPSEPLLLAELRAGTNLKMPDCCVIVAAQHETLAIATFDDQLARTAESLGLQTVR